MFTENGRCIWPQILEKAFAKYHGNYQYIRMGKDPTSAMRALTNAPSFIYSHSDAQTHWELLEAAALAGNMMQAKTGKYAMYDLRYEIYYSILGVQTMSTG